MDINLFEETLKTNLEDLLPEHKIAFAASCCERLWPNYLLFSQKENFGNPDILRIGLNKVWEFLIQENAVTVSELKEIQKEILLLVPEPGEFESIYVAPAEDAARAIVCTLECCLKPFTSDHIIEISSISIQTIDAYILERDNVESYIAPNPQFEEKIDSDPLMVEEITKQKEDIKELKGLLPFDNSAIQYFREKSTKSRISNIGITY